MPTLTIRNVPEPVVKRLKAVAKNKGHSMEQEVRELLATRYAERAEVLDRIRKSWETLPETSAAEANEWLRQSRP